MNPGNVITINTELESRDFFTAIIFNKPKIIYVMISGIAIALLGLSLVRFFGASIHIGSFEIFMFFIVIGVAICVTYFTVKNSMKTAIGKTQFVFSNKETTVNTVGQPIRYKWSEFFAVSESKDYFFLYPKRTLFLPVPKRSFNSDGQIQQFRELVRAQLGRRKAYLIH